MPVGAVLLAYANPDYLRIGVGVLLILYSSYFLVRPHLKQRHAGFGTETVVGFLNGALGGMTGLSGPIITMWCQLRGFPKDRQRSVYQPVILVAFAMTAISLAIAGQITLEFAKIYLYGLVPLGLGLWLGLKLYGHLNEDTFRKVILVLLLLSGAALILPLR